MSNPAPKLRWFQFSLRTFLVSVALFGGFAAWLVYHVNWIRERDKAKVGFGYLSDHGTRIPCHAPWPLNWLGEEGHNFIMIPDFHSEEEIDRIKALFPEAKEIEIVAVPANFVWPEGTH
jgi:hypothetical protein